MSVHHQNNSTSLKGQVIRIKSVMKKWPQKIITLPTSVVAITEVFATSLYSHAPAPAQPMNTPPSTVLPTYDVIPNNGAAWCCLQCGTAYYVAPWDGTSMMAPLRMVLPAPPPASSAVASPQSILHHDEALIKRGAFLRGLKNKCRFVLCDFSLFRFHNWKKLLSHLLPLAVHFN